MAGERKKSRLSLKAAVAELRQKNKVKIKCGDVFKQQGCFLEHSVEKKKTTVNKQRSDEVDVKKGRMKRFFHACCVRHVASQAFVQKLFMTY